MRRSAACLKPPAQFCRGEVALLTFAAKRAGKQIAPAMARIRRTSWLGVRGTARRNAGGELGWDRYKKRYGKVRKRREFHPRQAGVDGERRMVFGRGALISGGAQ